MPLPPSSYGGPYGYAASPLDTLLGPARRAGIVMFLSAAAALILGGLFLLTATMVATPSFQQTPQYQQFQAEMGRSGATVQMMQIGLAVVAGICLVYAVTTGVLAFFVRKGGAGPVVTALVITVVSALLMAVMLITSLASVNAGAICMTVVPLGVLVLQLVFLILAVTKAGAVSQWRRYLEGQGWSAQWPQATAYPPAPGYAYPGANPYALPPAPPQGSPAAPPPPPAAGSQG